MARKTAPLLVARLASAGTTLVLLAVVSRQRGAIDLGAVALGLTFGTLLAGASEAGMTSWMVREIARSRGLEGRMLSALLVLRALLLPPMAIVTALFIALAFSQGMAVIIVVTINIAVQQVAETGRGVFIAHGRMLVAGAHGTAENLLWLVAILAGIEAGNSTEVAFILGLAVMCLSSLSILALAWIAGWPLRRFGPDEVGAIRRELPVFEAFSITSAASLKIDTILIGLLLPTGAVAAAGAYFGATRLVSAFEYLPQALGRAVLPDLSRAAAASGPRVGRDVAAPAIGILLALSVPVPFVMVLGGTWILELLLGGGAQGYGWIMAWLALALPFRFVAYLYGALLTGSDAQAPRLWALVASLIVLVVIDGVAIPTLGVAGAVIGLIASSVALFVLYQRASRTSIAMIDFTRQLAEPLAFSLLAFVPAVAIKMLLAEPLASPASVAVYCVGYGLLMGTFLLRSTRMPLQKDIDAAS